MSTSTIGDEQDGEEEQSERPAPRFRRRAAAPPSDDGEDVPGAPFLDRSRLDESLNNKAVFDFQGRGAVDIDKEISNRNRLHAALSTLRHNDEAKVSIERMLPETWEGQPTKGFTELFHVNTFDSADSLLELIKRQFGGYLYQLSFQTPNKAGDMKVMTRVRVHINAPPIVAPSRTGGQNSSINGASAAAQNPNTDLVSKVFDTMQKTIDSNRAQQEDPRMFGQITNIIREMRASSDKSTEVIMKTLQTQIENMQKAQERTDRPDTSLIKFTSEQATAERDRLTSNFNMEKQQLLTSHQSEKQSLISQHSSEKQSLVTSQNMQLDSLKREHQMLLDSVRRDKESEISRLVSQLDSKKMELDMIKLSLETSSSTQINNMKSQYENQISNMKSQYELQNQLSMGRISALENDVKILTSAREQLQNEKVEMLRNKPNELTAVSGTLAAVKELASVMGLKKDEGGPSEPEIVTTMKAIKEIGIGDILGKITDRFTQQRPNPAQMMQAQGMQPMGMYNVPVDQFGRPMVPPPGYQMPQQQMMPQGMGAFAPSMTGGGAPPPVAQQHAPQQQAPQAQRRTHIPMPHVDESLDDMPSPQPGRPGAAPVAYPPQPSPAPQAAPQQPQEDVLAKINPEDLKPVAGMFEQAMNESWPMNDFADQVVKMLPHDMLVKVVAGGSDNFFSAVERLLPDSEMVSARGLAWLKNLFFLVQQKLNIETT